VKHEPQPVASNDTGREARQARSNGEYGEGVYVIRSTKDRDDDGPLYWSNSLGWTSRDSADRFYDVQVNTYSLPIGGEWVPTK
jgi:hypothetical protein